MNDDSILTLESLLEEMISFDEVASFPSQKYTSKQVSSYDRRSLSPNDKQGWFANDDGFGYERLDTVSGRIEKVLFEANGPGVVTRMWLTTSIKNGILRFYFDGEQKPLFEIPSYDMSKVPFYVGEALSMKHTNYNPDVNGLGGNTFMLPLPYGKKCKITLEEPHLDQRIPRYYHINYRTYQNETKIKTFSIHDVNNLKEKLVQVNNLLLNPPTFTNGTKSEISSHDLDQGNFLKMELPKGENAIRTLIIDVKGRKGAYGKMMRSIILKMKFDGKETVWVPLSDFSGAGFGSPQVESWFMSADGNGKIICRWLMPYKRSAEIELKSVFEFPVNIKIETYTTSHKWDSNTLYFHTSWKQEANITLNKWDAKEGQFDWNFITIDGRGLYRGDLLSLYNYAPDWYGEGDEKIYIDNEKFPSTFGTGTEDYYNCSWAPVISFHTPFGGAPRADNPSSHGFNAFFRTRNLDVIPFEKKICFDLEMLSWNDGDVDCATTVYWYGDYNSKVKQTSSEEELSRKIPRCN